MPRIRTAKVGIAAVYAKCAKCGADLSDPTNGSQMIVTFEVAAREAAGLDVTFTCPECGTENRLPAKVYDVL
jgi:hypothetical protein